MKSILALIALFICSFQSFSQTIDPSQITDEMICRGAAVSVVGNIKPFVDRGFTKEKTLQMITGLVKEPIKDAPSKAYDLLKGNKSKDEVTKILYTDFMKLDKKVISNFLINALPD